MKKNIREKLAAAIERIHKNDSNLATELADKRRNAEEEADERVSELVNEVAVEGRGDAAPIRGLRKVAGVRDPRERRIIVAETIVLRKGRPVLAIVNDETQLEFRDAESEVWRDRLIRSRSILTAAARAVGRIEVTNHRSFDWLGTGWLVRPDIIVTNRHVAQEFGRRNGGSFVFRVGMGNRPMTASIDFLEEIGRTESREFAFKGILHIEDDDGPDMAFLRVAPLGDNAVSPIKLATNSAREGQHVAVIGYPARDSRIPERDLMDDIYGNVYDKKRLAPGQIIPSEDGEGVVCHDCCTLGGNSGSVVFDLKTGEAVALHFAGLFLEANFAVPAATVEEKLRQITGVTPTSRSRGREVSGETEPIHLHITRTGTEPDGSGGRLDITLPIRISVDVGTPVSVRSTSAIAPPASRGTQRDEVEEDDKVIIESRPEDYDDREGYDPEFLGVEVALPRLTKNLPDILTYDNNGTKDSELRYQHYSVMMSRSRRLCFFSAVNIDGAASRRSKRPSWRTDPRIPESAQILKECYGPSPKFSRGHMTRREDPVWGDEETAERGNSDSMHVTNTVPQLQTFNAGVWLALENYALENAREDDMKISVFTGPFLKNTDKKRFGVQIPLTFWKVIAFIHDQTGELCATGYTMSQKALVEATEHVFGAHETNQVSIKSIERSANLSFGPLADLDPMARAEELPFEPAPLTDVRQIRFF